MFRERERRSRCTNSYSADSHRPLLWVEIDDLWRHRVHLRHCPHTRKARGLASPFGLSRNVSNLGSSKISPKNTLAPRQGNRHTGTGRDHVSRTFLSSNNFLPRG